MNYTVSKHKFWSTRGHTYIGNRGQTEIRTITAKMISRSDFSPDFFGLKKFDYWKTFVNKIFPPNHRATSQSSHWSFSKRP